MQRKPGFPVANCSIKMPDGMPVTESLPLEDDGETVQRRQQLINFGHTQWGFNNWSWSVTKQELDFVDFTNGKYVAGVVAFVSITVKTFDIHRENIGYATSIAPNKGAAIYKSRKCAVTNALRETLLSFGGAVANDLMELLDIRESTPAHPPPETPLPPENNAAKPPEPKNSPLNKNIRKDSIESNGSIRPPLQAPPAIKNAVPVNPVNPPPPIAKAMPMPANLPPANRPVVPPNAPRPPPPHAQAPRPNSNEQRPLEGMSEEEARAERKRRQQRAQEEFRLRMLKNQENDEKQDMSRGASSFDAILMNIPSQDIEIEQTGDEETTKRKSPGPDSSAKRRSSVMSRLDIVTD